MEHKDLIESQYELEKRILKKPDFGSKPLDLNISEPVCVYSNGRRYRVVPLSIMYKYPVIYDEYFDKVSRKGALAVTEISVTFCPFTQTSVVYFGQYKITNLLYQNNIVLRPTNSSGRLITQLNGFVYSETKNKRIFEHLRKGEAKIMTLRNAITTLPDCQFLQVENISNKLDTIPSVPKDPIWGIEYLSEKAEDLEDQKYTALVPKKRDNKWDIQQNGITEYLDKMIEKIRDKGGVIIPSSNDAWFKFNSKSKTVSL